MGTEHWVGTALSDVVKSRKGKKPRVLGNEPFKNSAAYINIAAFERGIIDEYADIASSNLCKSTDILVVWDGARFGLAGSNQEGAIGSTLAALSPILVEPDYILKFIQRHYRTIQQKPKGMATPHVDPEVFWNLPFPLPPLGEQKRIVEKLDAILPRVKAAKARLEKIPGILKKFRQSVLAAACSGRLTEDWRDGKDLGEWEEKELGRCCEIVSGNAFKSADFTKSGVPVVKIANVQYGTFAEDTNQQYLPHSFVSEYANFVVMNGDILVALTRPITNNTLKVCEYPQGHPRALLNQRVALLRQNEDVSQRFVLCFMQSVDFRESIRSKLSETLQPNLSPKDLSGIPIAVPGQAEQNEIVRRVEKLFALADSLEAKFKKAMEHVERIEQAVLAKAFRGELAEADPNDEPAEELLKRILAEKEKLESGKKGQKGPANKKRPATYRR